MIPFERDDGKALRLAAIYRAFRASLSQRRWESHQPQEERHSRYLPHLQATEQNPASPSRRNPASSEVLGGEVLVPSQRRDRKLRTAGYRCVQQAAGGGGSYPATVGTAAPAGSGAALHGVAKEGSGALCIGRCFELGSCCLPAPAFIRLFPNGRRRSFPAAPAEAAVRRQRCPDRAPFGIGRGAPFRRGYDGRLCVVSSRPGSALGTWKLERSGLELLALGA